MSKPLGAYTKNSVSDNLNYVGNENGFYYQGKNISVPFHSNLVQFIYMVFEGLHIIYGELSF